MLVLDGSRGEGGGQILRSALALSLVTGTPFRVDAIRAGRARPGLMRQHVTAVEAAAAIGGAEVSGAAVGSRSLVFRPGRVRGGDHVFSVGTSGSATLVLQTVLPALVTAAVPSTISIEGGTHNPAAPPFDFLARVYFPLLRRMGPRVHAVLERPGFHPAGGGRIRLTVEPVTKLAPLELVERGAIVACRARAVVAHLPTDIARRELAVLAERLPWERRVFSVVEEHASAGPGNVVIAEVESEALTELFTGFGQRGRRAEVVAGDVADEVLAYLASGVPVGSHLADQLVLLFALAGGGTFRTMTPTTHTTTQLGTVAAFLGPVVAGDQERHGVWRFSAGGGR